MIPKAKKNLHACEYHLKNLSQSKHFEEVEINFAAFVNSARSTTFVLQKEFKKKPQFISWYGDPDNPGEVCEGTKLYEMKNDDLCKFFLKIRNQIVKEGINDLQCLFKIGKCNSTIDFPDKPRGSSLLIGNEGIYYYVNQGTAKEDNIPAISKTAEVVSKIFIKNAPVLHNGQTIDSPDLITISELYYQYLKNLVEEWTGIINNPDSSY